MIHVARSAPNPGQNLYSHITHWYSHVFLENWPTCRPNEMGGKVRMRRATVCTSAIVLRPPFLAGSYPHARLHETHAVTGGAVGSERHLRVDAFADEGDLVGDLATQVGDRTVNDGQRNGVENGV